MKILLFITLKIIELSALIVVPYWVGRKLLNDTRMWQWACGVAVIGLVLVVVPIIGILVYFGGKEIIDLNWQLVNRILGG